jgi:hypothetical protein
MNSLTNFIVKPLKERYNNKKKIADKELILSTDMSDHNFVSREAEVVSVPRLFKTSIRPGMKIIIHHNVFRRFYDIKGKEKNSRSYFKDNLYFVHPDQVYMYFDNGWKALTGYCFVQPIEKLSDNMFDTRTEERLKGIVSHKDSSGVVDIDELVGFTPYSEFEFIIDNKRLYRVPLNSISIKYERKGTERPYNKSWV